MPALQSSPPLFMAQRGLREADLFYFSPVNNSCGCTHVNSRQTSEVLGATLKPGLDFWGPPGHRPWIWTYNIKAGKYQDDESIVGLFNLRSDLSDHYF